MANSSQATVAQYKYDPFGRLLSSNGSLANANLLRFSSKEFHVNSGLYYYLYRFFDPSLERWLNRDPIGEFEENYPSEINVFDYVRNDPTERVDPFGLWQWGWPPWATKPKPKPVPPPVVKPPPASAFFAFWRSCVFGVD